MKKSLYSQAEAALAHKSKKLAESQLRFTNPDRLAATITEYIESRAFAFWVRLIVETEGGVSPDMKALLDERCPGFLDDVDAYRRAGAMSWYRFLRISRQRYFAAGPRTIAPIVFIRRSAWPTPRRSLRHGMKMGPCLAHCSGSSVWLMSRLRFC